MLLCLLALWGHILMKLNLLVFALWVVFLKFYLKVLSYSKVIETVYVLLWTLEFIFLV